MKERECARKMWHSIKECYDVPEDREEEIKGNLETLLALFLRLLSIQCKVDIKSCSDGLDRFKTIKKNFKKFFEKKDFKSMETLFEKKDQIFGTTDDANYYDVEGIDPSKVNSSDYQEGGWFFVMTYYDSSDFRCDELAWNFLKLLGLTIRLVNFRCGHDTMQYHFEWLWGDVKIREKRALKKGYENLTFQNCPVSDVIKWMTENLSRIISCNFDLC